MNSLRRVLTASLLPLCVAVSHISHADDDATDVPADVQDCAAQKAPGFSLPRSAEEQDTAFDTHQVCFKGRDISEWAAGKDMDITSGITDISADGSAVIITAHQTGSVDDTAAADNAALILLVAAPGDAQPKRSVLMTQRPDKKPEKSIDDFRITGFDHNDRTLYFETPAWEVSFALYAFPADPAIQTGKVQLRYVGPGSLDTVLDSPNSKYKGDLLVWRNEEVKDEGQDDVLYLQTAQGKKICKVDSDEDDYKTNPQCIK